MYAPCMLRPPPLLPAPSTTGAPQVPGCWSGLHYAATHWKVSVESGQPKRKDVKILLSEIPQYRGARPEHLAVKFTVGKHHLCVRIWGSLFIFFLLKIYLLRERERAHKRAGGRAEGEEEKSSSQLLAKCGAPKQGPNLRSDLRS